MQAFWHIVYNVLVIPFLWFSLQIVAIVSPKAQRGITGRSDLFQRLEQEQKKLTASRRIWFHSSSLGEFEQAKPIIAALRKTYSDLDVVVTFFSPSGYEHSRSYKLATIISYIPFDTAANARRFVNLIRPDVAVMVRYDIWPNHLWELSCRKIPTLLANATLRRTSSRFWFALRSFHHYLYNQVTAILTVADADAEAFRAFQLTQPELRVIGDTRYDQVWQRSIDSRSKHLIPPALLKRRKVLVVGSSWEEDDAVILPAYRRMAQEDPSLFMILVPHEPTETTLERLESSMNSTISPIRFSALNDYSKERVVLVDSIGILMALYQYADVAYVGGSFKQGIHNVLEPAAYGAPVLFGPRHDNSHEARELVRRGGGFVVNDADDCYRTLQQLLNDKKLRSKAGTAALQLVKENTGATDRFLSELKKYL
jgi:3-deoxy-D-manno-octulosonic-acid transferase